MIEVLSLPDAASDWRPGSSARGAEALREAGRIVEAVREGGDAAVRQLTRELDGVDLERSRVASAVVEEALTGVQSAVLRAMRQAAEHIALVAASQRMAEEEVAPVPGVRVWREWRAFDRVGLYVPGGRAPYPSSVLMLAVPARAAGCPEVVLCSPPGPDGRVRSEVLAAAAIAGATEVYAIGGAQAIAAMAYGTETMAPVQKVFGPGNAYVTAAKRLVFGDVAVDMPAGPSEVVVLSDGSVPAAWLAADLDAQSEHAPDALGVLISTERDHALEVGRLVRRSAQVRIFCAPELAAGIDFVNRIAPEHLIIACKDAKAKLPLVRNAGSVFLGAFAPAAAGDYATGASHVLPTGGAARSFSPLGLEAFGHTLQAQAISPLGLARLAPVVEPLAGAEGFQDHLRSVTIRLRPGQKESREAPRARAAVRSLRPYEWEPSTLEVARRARLAPAEVVRFDTNTCPWQLAELAELGPMSLAEYPDSTYAQLTGLLAEYVGVPGASLTVGAGADEVLDLLARSYVGTRDPVVIAEPTYSMFRVLAEMAGAEIVTVADGDRDELLRASRRGRVTFVCNPNNPTGTTWTAAELDQLAEGTSGLIVVDEAYFEFSGVTAASLVTSAPNLVVVRTLSKAFGLAGARVGYAISGSGVAATLARVRPPASVSSPAAALACLALGRVERMRALVAALVAERGRLAAKLAGLGLAVRPTEANFLLVTCPPRAAEALLEHGLVVRAYPPRSSLHGWMRVAVRSVPENDRLLQALARVMGGAPNGA